MAERQRLGKEYDSDFANFAQILMFESWNMAVN